MTSQRLFNIAMVIAIALTLGLAFHLDEPPPQPTPLELARQAAFDYCGEGAAFEWKPNGNLKCGRHDGLGKLVTVEPAP